MATPITQEQKTDADGLVDMWALAAATWNGPLLSFYWAGPVVWRAGYKTVIVTASRN